MSFQRPQCRITELLASQQSEKDSLMFGRVNFDKPDRDLPQAVAPGTADTQMGS